MEKRVAFESSRLDGLGRQGFSFRLSGFARGLFGPAVSGGDQVFSQKPRFGVVIIDPHGGVDHRCGGFQPTIGNVSGRFREERGNGGQVSVPFANPLSKQVLTDDPSSTGQYGHPDGQPGWYRRRSNEPPCEGHLAAEAKNGCDGHPQPFPATEDQPRAGHQ